MHGTLLFMFASYVCFSKREPGTLAGEWIVSMPRYLFLLMGVFSMFCGLVYNDLSSMTTQLTGKSCYKTEYIEPGKGENFVWAEL